MRWTSSIVVLGAAIALAAPATTPAAQFSSAPSSSDVTGLQRRLDGLRTTFAQLRSTSTDAADTTAIETELNEVGDELAFLRVRTRRGDSVSDRDRRDIADRITRLESRIAALSSSTADPSVVPVGTEIDLRLQTPLSSRDATVEQRVDATTVVNLSRQGRVAIPAGSAVRGHVVAVDPASRLDRRGSLVLRFTHLTVKDQTHDVTLSITQALESEGIRGEAGRIGVGAGVGAVIGGLLNGVKGVLAGILIGSGGAVLATEGKDVELPVGTILRVRFDAPLDLGR